MLDSFNIILNRIFGVETSKFCDLLRNILMDVTT